MESSGTGLTRFVGQGSDLCSVLPLKQCPNFRIVAAVFRGLVGAGPGLH